MKALDDTRYELSSGRVLSAGALGFLCPDLSYGYDLVQGYDSRWSDEYDIEPPGALTREERREVAEHFIALWREWAEK